MMDKIQSQTIDLLRFPMAVFVVFIHTQTTLELVPINEATFPLFSGPGIYNIIEMFLKHGVTQIAVPVFFVISGYLFFQKLNDWNWGIYKSKLQSRVITILVPYLCWTAISYLCIAGIPTIETLVETSSFGEAWKSFCEHRYSILSSFWIFSSSPLKFPDWFGYEVFNQGHLVPPLWYIRNLMVAMVCSPLFHWFVKKTKVYGMMLLCVYYLSNHSFIPTTIFFFAMGAYLAINGMSIVEVTRKIKTPTLLIAIVSVIALTYFGGRNYSLVGFRIYPFYIILGVWSAFYISSYLVEKHHWTPNRFLTQSCFFVYALHYMRVLPDRNTSLVKYSYVVTRDIFHGVPHTDLLIYLIPPIATILLCLALFRLLQRFAPRLCGLLTGNRC